MAQKSKARAEADRTFAVGLARAFGGAIFFSLPLLMTMEMWYLGFYLEPFRIALLIIVLLPLLVALDRISGFMETSTWIEDAVDAVIAFGVGLVAAGVVLFAFNLLEPGMPLREVVGKLGLQAVPGSFGAVLANSQFSADHQEQREQGVQRRGGYPAQLLYMTVGAVFLAFNVAPTEEIVLLAARMSAGHAIALLLLTLAMMHGFVYAAGFRGSPERPPGIPARSLFLRYTLVGYAVALLISVYVLWTFGRLDGVGVHAAVAQLVVLSLPAGLGAAAARLVL